MSAIIPELTPQEERQQARNRTFARQVEMQKDLIEHMTSHWKEAPCPMPRGARQVIPHWCEHCDNTMTESGNLPAKADIASWAHWSGWGVGDGGVLKVHSLSIVSAYGVCCTSCSEVFDLWQVELAEDEGPTEGGAK